MIVINFEFNQRELNKKSNSEYNFPIFFLSELITLAFGFMPEELGFKFHRIKPSKLFKSINFTV
jgi:heterodisulfide reductase subunit B